ncbi:MAG: rhombosortase, partial [Bacteroidetes bacterium]|nr:rhombosortase [Bacteroidota bacterium]
MNSTLPLKKAIFFPFVFVALTWLIHIVNWSLNGELVYFGTYPRTINHWYGILTGALIHGNFDHLISNTLPFLILGTLIFISYQNIAHKTFIFIYLFTGSAIF